MKRNSSRAVLQLLRAYESRNVTFQAEDGTWPMVWDRAQGVYVWDAEGRKYLDLTGAFGVAAAGHANRAVVRAGQAQMRRLLHAMGDVHPHAQKALLARELSRITFERWTMDRPAHTRLTGKSLFGNSGFEAVEAALKTAFLATHKAGIVAFAGAYHGLGYGALNTTHRQFFRSPFRPQLREFARFVPYPTARTELAQVETEIRKAFRQRTVGAILVEPIQVRGGINVPPAGFLPMLRSIASEYGALLILDEIYTGFGRTGTWFACEQSRTLPDLICLGKALTGGFPLSVCVGRADLVDSAWPPSTGEAIHTSTFLGHPVGCAMALAQIQEIRRKRLPERSRRMGEQLLASLAQMTAPGNLTLNARGCGLVAGLELRNVVGKPAIAQTMQLITRMLQRGYLLIPEGEHANVVSFTPPLTITANQLSQTVGCLAEELARVPHDVK